MYEYSKTHNNGCQKANKFCLPQISVIANIKIKEIDINELRFLIC